LDYHEVNGHVPEIVTLGQMADISALASYGWYDWMKYWDLKAPFPEPKVAYGKWLGPAIGIRPAITSKLLKENGQVVYASSLRPLTEDKLSDEQEKKL